jgi:hypothetical protein
MAALDSDCTQLAVYQGEILFVKFFAIDLENEKVGK